MDKTENRPTVSVIIPTNNRAHLIGRAIHSVLDQTYDDFEIIVVDDGSTDNTREVVEDFKIKYDRIIYIQHKINEGAAAARNTGIRAANGCYIAFQDSDDEWLPEKLQRQMAVFTTVQPEVDIVYSDMWLIKGKWKIHFDSPKITPEHYKIFYKQALGGGVTNIGIQTTLIRRKCFEKVGLFDDKLRRLIDYEFFIRASMHCRFYHISDPLVNYFYTNKSISTNVEDLIVARKLILEKYFDDIKKDNKYMANHYMNIGTSLCMNKEFEEGENYFSKALSAYHHIIEYNKSLSNNYFSIGVFLIKHGFFINGRSYLVRAAKMNPLKVKFLLADFLSLFGQDVFNKVLASYRKIKDIVGHIGSAIHS